MGTTPGSAASSGQDRVSGDVAEHKRAGEAAREREPWLRGQREALESAVNDAPLEMSLGALVRTATDALGDDVRAAFYLANEGGAALHHVVGMPEIHANSVDGFTDGPESLVCGLAPHTGQPVITGDVTTDERWAPWRGLAARFDYRGCWSFPIHGSPGRFAGTLALYWRQPREPAERDLELVALLTHTASLIIARHTEAMARRRADAALRRSEGKYRAIVETAGEGITIAEPGGDYTFVNQRMAAMLGYAPGEVLGSSSTDFAWDPAQALNVQQELRQGQVVHGEFKFRRRDGTPLWSRYSASPMFDEHGSHVASLALHTDVTELKRLEAERDRFFELSLDMMGIASTVDGRWRRVNPAMTTILGWTREELLAMPVLEIVHSDDQARSVKATADLAAGIPLVTFEQRVRCRDGSYKWVVWNTAPYAEEGLMYCVGRDTTERRLAEAALRASLAERETLLQEVHHRVKNNLEVIDSLLQLQRETVADSQVRSALSDTSNRVHAIAEVHHLLYSSPNLANVAMRAYADRLAASLLCIYGGTPPRVRVTIEGEDLLLDLRRAVPVGLVLNELISNALKHAYPGDRGGTIVVAFGTDGRQREVSVRDDGGGLPDPMPVGSLGLRLVHALAEQLEGSIAFETGHGTTVRVRFPAEAPGRP